MISQHTTRNPAEGKGKYHDGRDEMNLADFPISALQAPNSPAMRTATSCDRLEFEATQLHRFGDAPARPPARHPHVVRPRDGLPTPADEHVVLALLFVAKLP